jgi:hypothetical protein
MKRLVFASLLFLPAVVFAQVPPAKDADKQLSDAYKGKAYSPYAKRGFPSRPYWGDTHLHTGLSLDAGAFGCRLRPADAYQFARGDEIKASTGQPVRLSRPLDWLVVADHSDQMGFFLDLFAAKPHLMKTKDGKRWYDMVQRGEGVKAAYDIINKFANQQFPEDIAKHYKPTAKAYKSVWKHTVQAAEDYNEPGRFTAFIGYEWTSLIKGNNMHRVVIYRDDASYALQTTPFTTFPPEGSINPRDLWKWMQAYEKNTGGDVLAIAHNGNLANGIMFPIDAQYDGRKLDAEYINNRIKWEPLYEITQIKGDGETHPLLSPNDEFADYETWDIGNLSNPAKPKEDSMLAGEYAREALKRGLWLEKTLGVNPYKFGFIGSTDSHTGLATAQEDNFWGKHSGAEPKPDRMAHQFMSSPRGVLEGWAQVASGLAAVWAMENTRESIFDAMERKETYATTGSRMGVRFFGGWNFNASDLNSRTPAFNGYTKGVPMGGDLPARGQAKAPTFMTYALRDPIGANLDRIQIIKGWLDAEGKMHEKVYDVAWSGDRKAGADGKLPAVGNTVDPKTANYTNTIGAPELMTVWTDPSFDPAQRAFYYVRVIEIPTPRWSTIEAFRYGLPIPKGAPVTTQERAYTSPIWYTPPAK